VPASFSPQPQEKRPLKSRGALASPTPPGHRPRLLLVEDSPDLGALVRLLGKKAGCEVAWCSDVASAWEQIQQAIPDLVLLDRNLPGENGLVLVRRIRQSRALNLVPVALFCHESVPGDQADALEAGVDFFFFKDLVSRPAEWQRRLFEILDCLGASGRSPSQAANPLRPTPPLSPPATSSETADAGPSESPLEVSTVNRALQHPALREVRREPLRVLLRQVLVQALPSPVDEVLPGMEDCILEDGFLAESLVGRLSVAQIDQLASFLGHRLGRLFGEEVGASFLSALGPVGLDRPHPEEALWEQGPDEQNPLPASKQRPSPVLVRPARCLLLVEDNEAEIKITQRALRQAGISAKLTVVRDGQEALDHLLGGPQEATGSHPPRTSSRPRLPDLILLDLNLPRLTGREVLARIRAEPTLRLLPVVILTHSRRQEDVRDLYALGANTYIEKPRDFTRFVQVLKTLSQYWLETALLPPR
jgi:CheY-like chemotaxis protein